jgi:hypothetical protein
MIDLPGRLEGVTSPGPNRWLARCPGPLHEHGDRHRSLSIRLIEGDRWLLYCFAGCRPLDICTAIGISLSNLFHDELIRREYTHGKDRRGKAVPKVRASEYLEHLNHEAGVVALIAADMIMHPSKILDGDEVFDRLAEAYRNISRLRAECMAP